MAPKRKRKPIRGRAKSKHTHRHRTTPGAATSTPTSAAPTPLIFVGAKTLIIHAREIQRPQSIHPTGHLIYAYEPPNTPLDVLNAVDRILHFPGSDHRDGYHDIEIVGTQNGVVCVVENLHPQIFHLWNPATNSSTQIPPPPHAPNAALSSAGLGFDPSRNDYKIVRIIRREDHDHSKPDAAEVFSVRSGKWKNLISLRRHAKFRVLKHKCEAVVGGVPYWTAETVNDETALTAKRQVMLSFDVKNDVFDLSDYAWDMEDREICIGEINENRVGAVVWGKRMECLAKQVMEVWMMKDEKESGWSKVYNVERLPVVGKVLGFYGERRVVIESGFNGKMIVMFNLENRETEDFVNVENALAGSFRVVRYRESLTAIPQIGKY